MATCDFTSHAFVLSSQPPFVKTVSRQSLPSVGLRTDKDPVLMFLEEDHDDKSWYVKMKAHISEYRLQEVRSSILDIEQEADRSGSAWDVLTIRAFVSAGVSGESMRQAKSRGCVYAAESYGSADLDDMLDAGASEFGDVGMADCVKRENATAKDEEPPRKRVRAWKIGCEALGDLNGERPVLRLAPITNSAALYGSVEMVLPSNWSDPRELIGPVTKPEIWKSSR